MPLATDPLSSPQPPSRVYYSLGRMLGVEDFQADQDYHRGRLARALQQLCGTGTVAGLKVQTGVDSPGELEIQVTAGIAVDRAGRILDVPRTVCIRIENWLSNQTASDLNLAFHAGNILVDVFATFAACTRGATPCFATQDDYDATDAFSPNRLLDSFAMQLVLRTDAVPKLPQDPWLETGPSPATQPPGSLGSPDPSTTLKQTILDATAGPAAAPVEYPPGFDTTSVFLARIYIPAQPGTSGQPPTPDLSKISIDNFSRLFLYPGSLVARWVGLSSGTES